MDKLSLVLVIIGAINWGLVGLFQFDLIAFLFGGQAALVSRVLYTIVGVGVPLGGLALYRHYAKTVDFSTKSCVKYTIKGLIKLGYYIYIGIKKTLIYLWQCLVGFWRALKDIVKASSPNEE